MNRIIIVIALALATGLMSFLPETKEEQLAKVESFRGKYIYVMSEPVGNYEEVNYKSRQFINNMMGNKDINEEMQIVITKGLESCEEGEMSEFDAVMTQDGKHHHYIKFIE